MAFFGYMEGALESGVTAAERIATAAGFSLSDLVLATAGTASPNMLSLQASSNGEQFGSATPVQATNSSPADRSNVGIAMMMFNNAISLAWIGLSDLSTPENYLNVVQATYAPSSQGFTFGAKTVFAGSGFPQSNFCRRG